MRKTQEAINEMELIYPGEVHAQFQLREEVQNDAALFFDSTQILLLDWRGIVDLLRGINLLLLLKHTPNSMMITQLIYSTNKILQAQN